MTLLTINKFHSILDSKGYGDNIRVCSSIYDSIYITITPIRPELIKFVNDTIIPLLTTQVFEDEVVHNEAEGEIGYNWADTLAIHNNASIEEIEEVLSKLKEK